MSAKRRPSCVHQCVKWHIAHSVSTHQLTKTTTTYLQLDTKIYKIQWNFNQNRKSVSEVGQRRLHQVSMFSQSTMSSQHLQLTHTVKQVLNDDRLYHTFERVSEWVIKFYGLSRTADSEVHIVHISRVIIACTLKSLSSPHIDNTQSTSYK